MPELCFALFVKPVKYVHKIPEYSVIFARIFWNVL